MAINIDYKLLDEQIECLSDTLGNNGYPEEHTLWGVLYLLEELAAQNKKEIN
jgi:hypothetical protein